MEQLERFDNEFNEYDNEILYVLGSPPNEIQHLRLDGRCLCSVIDDFVGMTPMNVIDLITYRSD